MKKVLVVMAVLAIAALAIPASAQAPVYKWSDGFDWATSGNLSGQGGWTNPLSTTSLKIEHNIGTALSPFTAVRQAAGVKSVAKKDLRFLNSQNLTYVNGSASFWVYDALPKNTAGAIITGKIDTRVGVYSAFLPAASGNKDGAGAGENGSMTYVQAAGISDTRWADKWGLYASSGFIPMDGAGTVTTAPGYSVSSATLAPRVQGWNNVIISWAADPVAKKMHADYYINVNWDDPQINASLDIDWSSASNPRAINLQNVAGVFIGSGSTFQTNAQVDDVYFEGNVVPEPAGMMALGTGLVGLMGLIRRKK